MYNYVCCVYVCMYVCACMCMYVFIYKQHLPKQPLLKTTFSKINIHHPQILHCLEYVTVCMLSQAVHALMHMHTPQHYKSSWVTNINLC